MLLSFIISLIKSGVRRMSRKKIGCRNDLQAAESCILTPDAYSETVRPVIRVKYKRHAMQNDSPKARIESFLGVMFSHFFLHP